MKDKKKTIEDINRREDRLVLSKTIIDDRSTAERLRDHIDGCLDDAFWEWVEDITYNEASEICFSREFLHQSIIEKLDDYLQLLAKHNDICMESEDDEEPVIVFSYRRKNYEAII